MASAPANAGQEFLGNTTIQACGKWVYKIKGFGKQKIRDYNAYVPANLQTNPGTRKPSVDFQFIPGPASNTFFMGFTYPDKLGVDTQVGVFGGAFGTYTQKGKKLKLRLNDLPDIPPGNPGCPASSPNSCPNGFDGIRPMQQVFADLVSNHLFGERQRSVLLPFVDIRENKIRFKGRVKNRNSLRMKMKTRLFYDIQSDNNSELPERFGADGVLKLRMKTNDCS